MSTAPAPSVSRGEILLQPSYFTSSLFVDAVREDIAQLVQVFAHAYLQPQRPAQQDAAQADDDVVMRAVLDAPLPHEIHEIASLDPVSQPFAFFKAIWKHYGWPWFHFKVLDGRARETFIRIVLRCFSEYFIESVNPLAQTIALFGLYTFFMTQPSTSSPSLHVLKHIPMPLDIYETLLELPENLAAPHLLPLRPYATYLLETLLSGQAFHILPRTSLRAQNPSEIPRERFVEDSTEAASETTAKKKGRPSKRDKARRAKDAIAALDRWLDKNTYTYPDTAPEPGASSSSAMPKTTHTLISHPPEASRAIYSLEKTRLLGVIDPARESGAALDARTALEREALARANDAVLARLKKIDELAAERGLEVGGEGGERTGLGRVERAVEGFKAGSSRGGILGLLEGAGLEGDVARTGCGPME